MFIHPKFSVDKVIEIHSNDSYTIYSLSVGISLSPLYVIWEQKLRKTIELIPTTFLFSTSKEIGDGTIVRLVPGIVRGLFARRVFLRAAYVDAVYFSPTELIMTLLTTLPLLHQ